MRQLITRIDDDLHRRLKERARDEGRSVNALVIDILDEAVPDESARARFRRRLKERGMLVEVDVPEATLTRDEVREILRGEAGKAVLKALDEGRADRF